MFKNSLKLGGIYWLVQVGLFFSRHSVLKYSIEVLYLFEYLNFRTSDALFYFIAMPCAVVCAIVCLAACAVVCAVVFAEV